MRNVIGLSVMAGLIATAGQCLAASSPAATRSWTSNFVNQAVASVQVATSNAPNAKVYSAGSGENRVTLTVESATVYALMATNATEDAVSQGVTNSMYFVWHGETHSYTNHADAIVATPTNFVWRGVESYGVVFSNLFEVVGRLIQPTYAEEVTR